MASLRPRACVAWSLALLLAGAPATLDAREASGADGTWELLSHRPSNRKAPGAAFDPVRRRVIVVGGEVSSGWTNGVLALELDPKPRWRRLQPQGEPPEPRSRHSLIYDAARDRMILFGGTRRLGLQVLAYDDVWELTLAEPMQWRLLGSLGPPPTARFDHVAVLDSVRARMLIFGGARSDSTVLLADAWEFALDVDTGWSPLEVATPGPTARLGHAAVFDAGRDRLVLCGGYDGAYRGDIWELAVGGVPEWHALPDSFAPRAWHRAMVDPSGRRVIVHGGRTTLDLVTGFQAYDLALGGAWDIIASDVDASLARSDHVFVFDPSAQQAMISGGGFRGSLDAWSLSLAGDRFESAESVASPGHYAAHTLTYDPIRHRVLLFGGLDAVAVDELWTLDCNLDPPLWSRIETVGSRPPPRHGHSAVYDPNRDRLLVFGGIDGATRFNDLWELPLANPIAWNRLEPFGVPPDARNGHGAVYDAAGDRMLIYAGNRGTYTAPPPDDVWEMASAPLTWTQLPPLQGVPVVRNERATLLDAGRNRLLVHGSPARYPASWSLMEFDLSQGPFYEWRTVGDFERIFTYPYSVFDAIRDRAIYYNVTWSDTNGYRPELFAFEFGDSTRLVHLDTPGEAPTGAPSSIAHDLHRDRFIVHVADGTYEESIAATWAFVPATRARPRVLAEHTTRVERASEMTRASVAVTGAPRCEDMPSPETLRRMNSQQVEDFRRGDGKLDLEALRLSGYSGPLTVASLADSLWDDGFAHGAAPYGSVRAAAVHAGKLWVAIGGVVYTWDGTAWATLPAARGVINAMTVFEGNVVVGTEIIPNDGGQIYGVVERWTGTRWLGFGGFFYAQVRALAVYGPWLIAGGDFTREGSFSGPDLVVPRIGMWGGPQNNRWYPLPAVGNPPGGSGGTNGPVRVLALHDGQLIVGGVFTRAGNQTARYIASWCCGVWTPFDDGKGFNSYVSALATAPDGALVVGGTFTHAGRPGDALAVHSIARWNGNAWNPLGNGFAFQDRRIANVRTLANFDGALYAGGDFDRADGLVASNLARWNGNGWELAGATGTDASVVELIEFDGRLHAAGDFLSVDGRGTGGVVEWTGSRWRSLPDGDGLDYRVRAFATFEGALIAGGSFGTAGNSFEPVRCVARWTGSGWEQLGDLCCDVFALAIHGDRLCAGGQLATQQVGLHHVARWEGDRWEHIGDPGWLPYSDQVRALVSHRGDLIAGGTFRTANGAAAPGVASWDGTRWSPLLGGEDPVRPVNALRVLADTLYAAGNNGVHAWDGVRWTRLAGVATHPVLALTEHEGRLVAGGRFWRIGTEVLNGVATWNNHSWHAMGSMGAEVRAFTNYQGQLVATGEADSSDAFGRGIALWDGARWSPFGSGLAPSAWDRGGFALHEFQGDLWVGGWFNRAGPHAAVNVSRYRAPQLGIWMFIEYAGAPSSDLEIALVTTSPPVEGSVEMEANGVPVALHSENVRTWTGRLALSGIGGRLELRGCVRNHSGMRVCSTRRYAITPSDAATSIASVDGSLRLTLAVGALPPGGYVVVESDSVLIPLDPKEPPILRGWRVHPATEVLGDATIELRYPDAAAAQPDAIALYGPGGTRLATLVDPGERVVRAHPTRLGDFVLRIETPGTSTVASPRFLDFAPNVPNPFNPTTRIRFTIETTQRVRVEIHDARGRRVAQLLDAPTSGGTHDLVWDGRTASGDRAASGAYLCSIATENTSATRKLVLVR